MTGIYRSFGFFKSVDKDVNVARAEAEQSFLDEKAKELERRKNLPKIKGQEILAKRMLKKIQSHLLKHFGQ